MLPGRRVDVMSTTTRVGGAGAASAPDGISDTAGRLALRVERHRDGSLVAPLLFSSGVLAARLTGWGIWIIGCGAQPIGGDALSIELSVGSTATLDVRATGATIARPGRRQSTSNTTVAVDVEDGATLRWLVEPGMAASGATHVSEATVRLSPSARLVWREEVVVGRFGEPPGTWSSGIRVEKSGVPLIATRLGVGPAEPAWRSPAVLNGSRVVIGLIVVNPDGFAEPGGPTWLEDAAAHGVLSHAAQSSVAQIIAWGESLETTRAVAACLLDRLDAPTWVGDIW